MVSDLLSIGDATEAGGCKKPEVGASVTIFGFWTRWNGGYWPRADLPFIEIHT